MKGIFKSLWSDGLLTYHGAFTVDLNTLDWNLYLHVCCFHSIKNHFFLGMNE
jgi:hypothetical protein